MTAQCRHVAEDQPRMLRTHLKDCNTSGCGGCQPCQERHCSMPHCPGRHLNVSETQACAHCVGEVRTNVNRIVGYCQSDTLVEDFLERGPRSAAAWILAETADADRWHRREELYLAASAAAKNPPAGLSPDQWRTLHEAAKTAKGWLEDNRHEYHPMWVLGCWDMEIRRHYGHDITDQVTVAQAGAYILEKLTDLARDPGFDFKVIARDMAKTVSALEHVLPVDHGPQKGAPCPHCGRDLEKVYDVADTSGASDRWHCKPCDKWWKEAEYQLRVATDYLGNAKALTASQIKAQFGIPEGTVRRWACVTSDTDGNDIPARVRKRGRNQDGMQLYDVPDVEAQIKRRNGAVEEAS